MYSVLVLQEALLHLYRLYYRDGQRYRQVYCLEANGESGSYYDD